MELKHGQQTEQKSHRHVLIAPLWNWNWRNTEGVTGRASLNRTFMELKHDAEVASNCPKCLNRTFMELKRNSVLPLSPRLNVLIAPLWNWNSVTCPTVTTSRRVLIAPLWNWNEFCGCKEKLQGSLNRTFMELKLRFLYASQFAIRCLNRTFMESKPVSKFNISQRTPS